MSASGTVEKSEEADGAGSGGGELLFCGGTVWDSLPKKTMPVEAQLVSPTRIRSLVGVDIRFVASSCSSCHFVALDVEGRCYTWGRNEKGQLGHGDTRQRSLPSIVQGLSKHRIVNAATGKNHTVVITDDGQSFSFGFNKYGQLGTGSSKVEIEAFPVESLVSQATVTACGADFTVWLSSVEGSSIITAGLPQYGQLGHGTDNEYNTKDSSVRLAYEPQPRPRSIASLSEKTIIKVACGTNHTVAADSNGFVYTWGFGGYGRLGHREPKDEWAPRLVEVFQRHNVLPHNAIVCAGSVSSACTGGGGQLYMWGKMKINGDEWMYPKPVMDLSGWNIRCMASGNMHHFIGADDSCISWGVSQFGELGYGPLGQKSSVNPKKVDSLDGMHVISVACGLSFSVIVVDKQNIVDRLDEFEVFEGAAIEETEVNDNGTSVMNSANKLEPKAANSKKRKQEDSSDEDESENESDDYEANGKSARTKSKRRGKSSGRGRGKGGGGTRGKAAVAKSSNRGSGHAKAEEKGSSGRARGRKAKS
ncbi:Ultraviolet-B receptor UVR8 [Platanthera zijinensis]|uniref:Ultraviolet-B receptor UVR8 n=1 Tax=Platanthera zijinensis TaxID=2320716 RepID=A0AAP0BMY4_9ASPA